MTSGRTVIVDLDRSYDLRVLAALPGTLSTFAARDLELHLRQMAEQRRAICFTLMAPIRRLGVPPESSQASIATVLVCLHVACEFAANGLAPLMAALNRFAALGAEPVHELTAPLTRAGQTQNVGFYREAIYGDGEAYVAITTHTPAEIPAEAAAAVAEATKGAPVDVVTAVALTPHRPAAAQAIHQQHAPARPTLH